MAVAPVAAVARPVVAVQKQAVNAIVNAHTAVGRKVVPKSVVKVGQKVVRNKAVQGLAIGAATIATGGAAGAAMGLGTGAFATGAGSFVANAALNKAAGNGFNLKRTAIAGLSNGLGAGGEVANKIGMAVDARSGIVAANGAYKGYQAAKKQGQELAAANAELSALNQQIAQEQQRAKMLDAKPAASVASPLNNTQANGAKPPAAPVIALAGGAVALKLLAFL